MFFTQEELIMLTNKAEKASKIGGTNPLWVRAYQQLADAADRLEAMIARCTIGKPTAEKVEK